MMYIAQGSNAPITMTFPESVADAADIHAGLYRTDGTQVMHWTKTDMTISGAEASIPLTQQETVALAIGPAVFEVKVLDSDGDVILYEQIPTTILERFDKHTMP